MHKCINAMSAIWAFGLKNGYVNSKISTVLIANITLRRGGIWNLAQTPGKNLKTHEAKPSGLSNFSVTWDGGTKSFFQAYLIHTHSIAMF